MAGINAAQNRSSQNLLNKMQEASDKAKYEKLVKAQNRLQKGTKTAERHITRDNVGITALWAVDIASTPVSGGAVNPFDPPSIGKTVLRVDKFLNKGVVKSNERKMAKNQEFIDKYESEHNMQL